MSGGNPPTKGVVKKEFLNGYLSNGNAPLKVDQSNEKIKQRNNTSPPQRCLLDRIELRKHYKKKLCSDFVKVSDHSTDFQVNEAQVLTAQSEHNNSGNLSGQFISNKKSRSSVEQAEQMIPEIAPLQRTNSVTNSEDQKTRKKRESEMHSLMKKPYSSQKKGKIPEPEATKELVWDTRTSVPSGCQDLATGLGSTRDKIADCSSWRFSKNQSSVAAHDDRSQVETVAQQSGERKATIDGYCVAEAKPRVFVDVDGTEEIPSTSSKFKSKKTGYIVMEAETCRAEILLSNSDRQKTSGSVLYGCLVKGEQDHVSHDALLVQLEAFLKGGDCQRALEALKAWKQKGQQVTL